MGVYIESRHGHGFDVTFIESCIYAGLLRARNEGLPLVLVMERPPRGGQAFAGRNPAGPAMVLGCRKLWRFTWDAAGAVKRLHCDVYPVTWRSQILGMIRGPHLAAAEFSRAQQLSGKLMVSRDEAAATLIGEWAARAGVVGALIGPRTCAQARKHL